MYLSVMIFLSYIINVCSSFEAETENKVNDRLENEFAEKINQITTGGFVDSKRIPKFLTFNNDASNIRVEAVFAVPVLAIPIGGKSVDSLGTGATIPKVDINLKSIISMAGIFFLLFFVIPKLVQLYLPQKLSLPPSMQTTDQKQLNKISERIDAALNMFNVDVDSCAQKAICWTMNKEEDRKKGETNSMKKLVDALNSIPYLKYFIEDTWLDTVMRTAVDFRKEEEKTCHRFNRKCSITQRGLNNAAIKLVKYLYFPHQKR